jgi:hypothetical protein
MEPHHLLMNSSSNPLIKPGNPFERRLVAAVDAAKPGRSARTFAKPLPGGTSLTTQNPRSSSSAIHPFYILSSGKIHAGTVNGAIPTLGGTPIGESGNALTLTGSKYVYICNVWSLTFTSGFLSAASVTSRTITTSTSPSTDVQSGTTFTTYRLIAQIIDGKVQRVQQTTTNMNNFVCDQSSGAGETGTVGSTWTTA